MKQLLNDGIISRWVCPTTLARLSLAGILLLWGIASPAGAQDTDGDQMPDTWEIKFGLSETNASDALIDTDADGLTNLWEYTAGCDPLNQDSDADLVPDGADAAPVSRALILWGHPDWTEEDAFDYTAPSWILGAYRVDGIWSSNPVSWYLPETADIDEGSLNVDLDRNILANSVRYRLKFFDSTSGMLFMDLLDANGQAVVTDLFGNIQSGSNTEATVILDVPLATYTNAAVLHLWRQSGETRIFESLIYVDEDGDGLDRELEQQLETSDNKADTDGDGLSDYAEVFIYGANPMNPDTDGDGMPDGWEVLNGLNPNQNDAASDSDGDGVSNLTEYLQGRDPRAGPTNDVSNVVNLKVFTTLE
ncbi:MAG: hypothetical protein HYV36_03860 [Lentisphaerae bacterium]|nr:hypothetical protein [Lentisphaerota bacterium]